MIKDLGYMVGCDHEGCQATIRDKEYPYLTSTFVTRADAIRAVEANGWAGSAFCITLSGLRETLPVDLLLTGQSRPGPSTEDDAWEE